MGFTEFNELTQNPHFSEVQDVAPEHVKNSLDQVAVIDVREDDEWNGELGHIDGAKLVNLGTIPERLSEFPKDKTVVLVCKSGGRSARAAAFLKQQGYSKVYNMLGGMMLWNRLNLPVSRK